MFRCPCVSCKHSLQLDIHACVDVNGCMHHTEAGGTNCLLCVTHLRTMRKASENLTFYSVGSSNIVMLYMPFDQRPTFIFKSAPGPDHNHQQRPNPTHSITCALPWKNVTQNSMGMGMGTQCWALLSITRRDFRGHSVSSD